mmetsp:Transcript_25521/g.37698  ORF Transcript_25521/g.37698 Transcript_25521/m.37698 type:complete len:1026 (+) Transcript_25521:217-3294(+)|eukprot:CAMPEP_0194214218 /NCGR_PEP_ID=MMETSP0156-20130528/15364_1 /TAXON_ID=33649 /ORGANISM="Thalassionema nitzschioides, Strain L26-B" /LENGTH=1025 /DNA_ID=CAMNT_0038942441 /DNA_START=165 /DNA_END=3242 /DNA_ORIENTATION=-
MSTSGGASRHARLSERIQRNRRNRQWANASPSTSPTNKESPSKEQAARSKIERAAASYRRHRASGTNASKSELFPATSKMISTPPTTSPRSSPKSSPSKIPPPKAIYSSQKKNQDTDEKAAAAAAAAATAAAAAVVVSAGMAPPVAAVVVVKEEEEELDEIVDNVEMTLSQTEEVYDSPQSKSSSNQEAPVNKAVEEKAPESLNAAPWSNRLLRSNPQRNRATSAEVLPKSNHSSTAEGNNQQPPAADSSSVSSSSLKPTTTTRQPRGSVTKRYAPWEKRSEEEEQQERVEPPRVITKMLAPWQKPQPADQSDSHVAELQKENEEKPNDAMERPATVQARVPTRKAPGKLAPWQKPTEEASRKSTSNVATTESYAQAAENAARKPPGKLAPWQKPAEEESKKSSNAKTTESSSQPEKAETDEFKNLAPWQREMKLRKSKTVATTTQPKSSSLLEQQPVTTALPTKDQQAEEQPKNPLPAARSTPTRGKVQTPAWMRSAPVQPVAPTYQQQRSTDSRKNKQPMERTTTPQELPEEEEKKQEVEDNSGATTMEEESSSLPSGGSHLKTIVGGRAVIETPQVMSVAKLRASLGSNPSAPPLPGTKSLGDNSSPWRLAGNRKGGNRGGSPYLQTSNSSHGKANDDYGPSSETMGRTTSSNERKAPVPKQLSRSVEKEEAASGVSHVTTTNYDDDDSPTKSLAELAADSVVVMDYSQLTVKNPDELLAEEDAESMVSGASQNPTTPVRSELPTEFQDILGKQNDDEEEQELNDEDVKNNPVPHLSEEALRQHTQQAIDNTETETDRTLSVRERMQALELKHQNSQTNSSLPLNDNPSASRVLKFYSEDNLSEQEKHDWAGKDPEDDDDYVARSSDDGSASPDEPPIPITGTASSSDAERSQKENRFMDNFNPDPNDPFYNLAETSKKSDDDEAALEPEAVFGSSFWGTDMTSSSSNNNTNWNNADETMEFADDSFFSDNKYDDNQQSPFRVISLKPPRQSPATTCRVRRQQEASNDFGSGMKKKCASHGR